jgi:hypothetical protein
MMEKVLSQVTSGLWASEWWDIGHGYTVLVEAEGKHSIMRVTVKAGHVNSGVQQHAHEPPHWLATQHVDVTEKIARLASLDGLANLVDSGVMLCDDGIENKHLECPSDNVTAVLLQLEKTAVPL